MYSLGPDRNQKLFLPFNFFFSFYMYFYLFFINCFQSRATFVTSFFYSHPGFRRFSDRHYRRSQGSVRLRVSERVSWILPSKLASYMLHVSFTRKWVLGMQFSTALEVMEVQ